MSTRSAVMWLVSIFGLFVLAFVGFYALMRGVVGELPLNEAQLAEVSSKVNAQYGVGCQSTVGVFSSTNTGTRVTLQLVCDAKNEPRLEGDAGVDFSRAMATTARSLVPVDAGVTHFCVRAMNVTEMGVVRSSTFHTTCFDAHELDAADAGP